MKLIAAIALATTANATTAKHTLCYDNGSQAGQCLTEEIVYTAYNWDSTAKDLTAAGSDHLGEFTFDGSVQGDKTVITKTWTSGVGGDSGLVGTVNLHGSPDKSGEFSGKFDYSTNTGITGEGTVSVNL